ncbi:MAG: helix-turn-helix transcriptional regulator [Eubacteriales bacterium]|nr:helix-turn-helix transcriptional regulator [Eubacteriales bacterium]
MKSFGQKSKEAREILDLSQAELGEIVGVSQRSITAYETNNAKLRGRTVRKLARALNVSIDYLLNDDIDDPQSGIAEDPYLENIHETFGARAEEEAKVLLERNTALFAGGTLSQEAKNAFFKSVMTAYITCKEEARNTYGRKHKPEE